MKDYLKIYLKNKPLFLGLIRAKEAELFQKYLPFESPILDLGCGDGFFAKTTFGGYGKIDFGIDTDKRAVAQAKGQGVYDKVVYYDGVKLPFDNNSFNTIVSNCVLEHVKDLDRILTEIYRVLKPGGKLICTVMADRWEDYLFGNIFFGKLYKKWMRKKQVHRNLLSKSEWDKEFMKVGFKIEKRIGYLDKTASRWLDFLHYVSLPSLISYGFFGKWVLFPWLHNLLPVEGWLAKFINPKVPVNKSSALFYELVGD